jgi:enoyl-CoA hydratase/carnithine racemase
MTTKTLKRLRVERNNHVAEVILSSPNRLNAMDDTFFTEVAQVFRDLSMDDEIYVVILWAEGKCFSSGLDLKSSTNLFSQFSDSSSEQSSPAMQNLLLLKHIQRVQTSFVAISKCKKPVIAVVHGACIGGGMDMILSCDIRLGTEDSTYSIRETKIAIVADLGTLQRIESVVGKGFSREMAFTGSDYDARTVEKHGLLNAVYKNQEECLRAARQMANNIAENSPLVVQGTKHILNYSETHDVEDALYHVALWNAAMLRSDDLAEAIMSFMQKKKPKFVNKL